jgi:hypothetical protein
MNKNTFIKNRKGGQAVMTAVLLFLLISMSIIVAIITPLLRHIKVSSDFVKAKQGYYVTEAAGEDFVYRLNQSLTIPSSISYSLNGSYATSTITDNAGSKTLNVLGSFVDLVRSLKITVAKGEGIAFNYGLQAGTGGIFMEGNSVVHGSLYSNGDIDAISASIDGSAIAANSASLIADQVNDTPSTPTDSILFRNASASQDLAQSFQVSTTDPLNKVQFYIKKNNSPANATIRLVADDNGSPSTTQLPIGTMSLNSSLVTGSYGWVEAVFPSEVSLIPGVTYWLVLDNANNNGSSYYTMAANSAYSNGVAKVGTYGGSWSVTSPSGLDSYFKLYIGGQTSTIGRATYASGFQVGGQVWASNVKGTTAVGSMYCLTGTNNNKACDTSKGVPPAVSLPFSEGNINDWKDAAVAGGTITGNYTVGSAGATLGPKKITGNLTVGGGGTLTLGGPLWVEGSVTVTSGGKVIIPAGYLQNSEVIIADKWITVSGGGSAGSGDGNSYLFFVSTSRCPDDYYCAGNKAISISGGAGAIAANAQYGTISLSGGAELRAATANRLEMTGGAEVTYEDGLASPSFTSGPSGAWNVQSWKEEDQ